MRKILIYLILFMIVFSLNGQGKIDCNDVLEKEIHFYNDSPLLKQYDQFQEFNNCYLDSIDLEILYNGSFMGVFLVDLGTKENKIMFRDLLNFYNEFKETSEYIKIRRVIELTKRVAKKRVDLENWEEVKLTLLELEVPQNEIVEIESEILKNDLSNYTYEQLFRERKEKAKKEESMFKPPQTNSMTKLEKFTKSEIINYDEWLVQSKHEKKPLLLFFTGFGSVNAIKAEELILSDPSILKTIQDKYIFKKLYVDDKTKLEKEIVTKEGMVLRTVGNKNIDFQITKFQNNSQPLFVIIDENDQVIAQIGFVLIETFREFLKKGIIEE